MKSTMLRYMYAVACLLFSVSLSQAEVMGTNLLMNPGFEGPDHWAVDYWNGSGLEISSTDVLAGQGALRLDENGEWAGHSADGIGALDSSKTYLFSCWVKIVGFSSGDAPRVGYIKDGGASYSHYFNGNTEGWVRVTHQATGSAMVRPFAQWNGTQGSGYMLIDEVTVREMKGGAYITDANLMNANPDFESPDNGNWYWSADYWNGSGFETVTTDVHGGLRAFKVDEDTEWAGHNGQSLGALDPLKTYEFSFWAKVQGLVAGDQPRVGFYDQNNTPWNYSFSADTGQWVQVTHTFSGVSAIRPYVQWLGSSSSTSFMLVDDFAVREVIELDRGSGTNTFLFEDHQKALKNPGMGWVYHYFDNSLEQYNAWWVGGGWGTIAQQLDQFPGLTTIYLRLGWSYLEPSEGNFNWALLDNVINDYAARGYRVAFRFTCFESHADQAWATPQWVQSAGAIFRPMDWGGGVVTYEPDYTDPVFLGKLQNFLSAAAIKYDGNPNVDFIDVGTVGVWGEGNASLTRSYDFDDLTPIIDMHAQTFPHTLLAINDDFGMPLQSALAPYGLAKGMTVRDDSILYTAQHYSAWLAEMAWPTRPVILESDHFAGSVDRGVWGDGLGYVDAMEAYHASYVSCHTGPLVFLNGLENWNGQGDDLPAMGDLVDRMNLRLGYRLLVQAAWWPQVSPVGQSLMISTVWRNVGVAGCLPGGSPIFMLKDNTGQTQATYVDAGLNMKDLGVGPNVLDAPVRVRETNMPVPSGLPAGEYRLCVAVGDQDAVPKLVLPLELEDEPRIYVLGNVILSEEIKTSAQISWLSVE